MIAKPLSPGGLIGLCSPCHIADREKYAVMINGLQSLGYRVKEAPNLYKKSYLYGASPLERAADLNALIADDEVELILFGGGEGANEVLPYLDFEAFRRHPRRVLAYSDATTILSALWARTGVETYYGQSPNRFTAVTEYDLKNFNAFIPADGEAHIPSEPWLTLTPGTGRGILIGGYSRNFALQLGTEYFPLDLDRSYILFIEDHEKFGKADYYSAMLTHIEQSALMPHVRGFLMGHYAIDRHPELYERVRRLGERWDIPAACCDDFGHGPCHAILRIGAPAELDTVKQTLRYLPEGTDMTEHCACR